MGGCAAGAVEGGVRWDCGLLAMGRVVSMGLVGPAFDVCEVRMGSLARREKKK